jgi:hypothetical protein
VWTRTIFESKASTEEVEDILDAFGHVRTGDEETDEVSFGTAEAEGGQS